MPIAKPANFDDVAVARPKMPTPVREAIAAKKEALAAEFAKYDGAGEGKVSYEVLQEVLASFGLELNDQALITLMRRFDLEKEGKVSYEQILSMA